MAVRQDKSPVQFDMSRRPDAASILTSADPGVTVPVAIFPLHRGDSASGRVSFDLELAEMPKPIENSVLARLQAWVVPRPALPQFSGVENYLHAFHGKNITQLGETSRTPPALFDTVAGGAIAAAQASEFFATLGLCLAPTEPINTDYIDAYNLIQNFRLAAHSSKMTRHDYYAENAASSMTLKPAFWPRSTNHSVVPDYESALVTGALDLDVAAGQIPIKSVINGADGTFKSPGTVLTLPNDADGNRDWTGMIWADMEGITIPTTLADIDMARKTNAFAKRQATMAGADYSGFNVDDLIVSELMQGFNVPDDIMNRPMLLDSKTLVFGMSERHATDAANLDDSVSVGRAQGTLSLNVPRMEHGAIVVVTCEVMPERLYTRQRDEYLYCTDVDALPNALRDAQRTEPVDIVPNKRVDQLHTTPAGVYGYEPMNGKWR